MPITPGQELEANLEAAQRPGFWGELWERYVESQVDYRATVETLGRKLGEAGQDAWRLLEWFDSDRVQNPHEPDATYGAKGEGAQKNEHVGCVTPAIAAWPR